MGELDNQTLITTLVTLILLLLKKRRTVRRWWVCPILQMREAVDQINNQFEHMYNHDHELFFKYTRLTVEQFDFLLQLMGNSLDKDSIRTPLSKKFRLLFTLRY